MSDYSNSCHTAWDCKSHVVFIPRYRRKILYGQIRSELKMVFHRLAYQKECRIEEGYLVKDHVHMLISIPPK
ncbi:MAG: IS200/IS605 family transposase [Legionellales bacterium]|nr:IS200/IS605 family transposase [Legionellales bacterium]